MRLSCFVRSLIAALKNVFDFLITSLGNCGIKNAFCLAIGLLTVQLNSLRIIANKVKQSQDNTEEIGLHSDSAVIAQSKINLEAASAAFLYLLGIVRWI